MREMLQYERFETILSKLETRKSVRVAELSQELGVSESTVRRDITDLAKAGRLKKVFGGAVPIVSASAALSNSAAAASDPAASSGFATAASDPAASSGFATAPALSNPAAPAASNSEGAAVSPAAGRTVNTRSLELQEKEVLQADEKEEVAAYAAAMIADGDLVYIDAGTTTGSMIDHISCQGATFVTNGVRHAIRLAAKGYRTYLLSGRVKARTEAVIGHEAVGSLEKYHFSKCFIGTDGIDEKCGLTTADIDESMVKTEAISRSGEVYVLADSSKFGLVASVTFAPLAAGTVITDQLPDPGYRGQTEIIELRS